MNLSLLAAQVLFTAAVDGDGPLRFGFPLPATALARGLRPREAGVRLQWRPLQERPDPETGRLWVELAVTGARGRLGVMTGSGVGSSPREGGTVVAVSTELRTATDLRTPTEPRIATESRTEPLAGAAVERRTWRWCTGEVDWCEQATLGAAAEIDGERFAAGETLTTTSPAFDQRWLRVRIPASEWVRAGVLPALGPHAKAVREGLGDVAAALRELPGARGRGDYGRSHGVVTNLEFDTALGFARLGLALERPDLLARALASARHLVDHDLDPKRGLPFRHGPDHRAVAPEPGHVWLTGTLLVGCASADDGLVRAARSMAAGLARYPPRGQGQDERARDFGWPLLELETWLRFEDQPAVERAADHLAADVVRRFDAKNRVVRFGEGECQGQVFEERAWITGGVLLPALRAHARRRPSAPAARVIDALEQRLLALVMQGRDGLPVRYWTLGGEISGQVRLRGVADAFLLLEGIAPQALPRCLARAQVQAALRGVPAPEDPDLPTAWSMAARCTWILR